MKLNYTIQKFFIFESFMCEIIETNGKTGQKLPKIIYLFINNP